MKKTTRRIMSLFLVVLLMLTYGANVFAMEMDDNVSIMEEAIGTTDLIEEACERYSITEDECTAEVLADYLTLDLQQLTNVYSLAYPDRSDKFSASSVERKIPVHIVTTDEDGICLDFNDNSGYMVISNNQEVICWEASGDLDFLKSGSEAYYSIFDGFGYYIDDQFVSYEAQYLSVDELNGLVLKEPYAGQDSAGDGEIFDTASYVADRYGDGYTIKSGDNRSLLFTYFTQSSLSIYSEKKSDNQWYTEGNCSLASIFALMNYLKSSGKYTTLPAANSKTNYDATQDPFYSKYSGKSNYKINTPKSLPNLYIAIRQYAIDNYGYETGETNPFNIATMIEKVGQKYNASIDASHIVVWSYETQVVDEINAGYPVIINVANSATYGSHSMVVTGYRLYTKTTTVAGVNFNSYVKLIKVNDNWNSNARYFDFTNYNAFGSFVTVR